MKRLNKVGANIDPFGITMRIAKQELNSKSVFTRRKRLTTGSTS